MYKNTLLFAVFATVIAVALSDRKQDILFSEYGSFGTKVDFYSEDYLNGRSHTVELTKGACQDLPKSWQKRALSADTKGTCAYVCDEKDCKGTCTYVYPANGEQQLSKVNMARKIVSLQGCFVNRP